MARCMCEYIYMYIYIYIYIYTFKPKCVEDMTILYILLKSEFLK